MELRITIGNRQLMLILALITAVSTVGLALAYGGSSPQVVGHSLGEIDPGTFKSGTYIFPLGSNLQVQGSLDVGGNLNSANINVNNNLTVGQNITANKIIANTINIVCPSGFTSIESQGGRQLGCMQTGEANSGTGLDWRAANSYCFQNFGGKLPSLAEWYISMANFNLYDETDDYEWVDDSLRYDDLEKIIGSGSLTAQTWESGPTPRVFRCWIPV